MLGHLNSTLTMTQPSQTPRAFSPWMNSSGRKDAKSCYLLQALKLLASP